MAGAKYPSSGTVAAEPGPIDLDWSATALLIIDMQRDFLEPGGFGEMLGNDVSQLRRTIGPNQKLLAAFARAGLPASRLRNASRIGFRSFKLHLDP